ncbi:MAG: hypothetical protein ACRD16_15155, partial [Thermoanaerobaculia bacterium]
IERRSPDKTAGAADLEPVDVGRACRSPRGLGPDLESQLGEPAGEFPGPWGLRIMMVEDFTKVAVGSLVSSSRTIVRCSRCGRFGALEVHGDQSRRCVHIESSIVQTDGMLIEPRDYCELAHPASEETPRAAV